ncbi:hypothetical protein [Corynebacterium pseudokroppenstedtii]|nr:hypothetical protein [Corynebacterium pseudokroppenstedtii]
MGTALVTLINAATSGAADSNGAISAVTKAISPEDSGSYGAM